MSAATPPRESLNLRIRAEDRGLIDRAAAATGKTRTGFVLDAARGAAIDVLLDKTHWVVSEEQFKAILEAFDQPPSEKLIALMKSKPVWES